MTLSQRFAGKTIRTDAELKEVKAILADMSAGMDEFDLAEKSSYHLLAFEAMLNEAIERLIKESDGDGNSDENMAALAFKAILHDVYGLHADLTIESKERLGIPAVRSGGR